MLWKTPPVAMQIPAYVDYFMNYNIDDTEASITRKTPLYTQSVAEWGMMKNGDLTAFRQRGGKMISWIGNADPAVSPRDTIDWFKSVDARQGGRAGDFLKLFVVPGMNHCAGGVATDRFDMLTPLENWVERGVARPASSPRHPTSAISASPPQPAAVPVPAIRPLQRLGRHQRRGEFQLSVRVARGMARG